jgi:hypothetical protein
VRAGVEFVGDGVELGKPHPEPTRAPATRLRSLPPILGRGRRPGRNHRSKARRVTVLAVITTHPATALQEADLVANSMSDVWQYLCAVER